MAVEDRSYPSAENSSKHNFIQSILLPPTLQATVHWPLKSCFTMLWNQVFHAGFYHAFGLMAHGEIAISKQCSMLNPLP